jgi:hypothetical protein
MVRESLFKELILRKILSVENNRLKLINNIDIAMYDSEAWASNIQEIGLLKGQDYLYSLGYLMGEDAAKEVKEVRERLKNYLPDILNNTHNVIEITGFGIVSIYEENGKVKMIIENNHIIDFGKKLYHENSLINHFYCGVYNAFIVVLEQKEIKLKVESSICKGDEKTIFSS